MNREDDWFYHASRGSAGATHRFAAGGPPEVRLPRILFFQQSGEAAEANIANDTVGASQNLGNLLATDRATLSTAGRIDGVADVDFYNFDVSYNSVQQQGTGAAVMLDLD